MQELKNVYNRHARAMIKATLFETNDPDKLISDCDPTYAAWSTIDGGSLKYLLCYIEFSERISIIKLQKKLISIHKIYVRLSPVTEPELLLEKILKTPGNCEVGNCRSHKFTKQFKAKLSELRLDNQIIN